MASTGALFDPTGPLGHEVYFDSLAGVLPTAAERLLMDGRSERVPPEALRVGDRIRIAAGEAFAADGGVLAGQGLAGLSALERLCAVDRRLRQDRHAQRGPAGDAAALGRRGRCRRTRRTSCISRPCC